LFVGNEAFAVSSETPEDVATLYSFANLQGAKYRDFSASRAQVREQARERVREAMEAERHRAEEGSVLVADPELVPTEQVTAEPGPAIPATVILSSAPMPAHQARPIATVDAVFEPVEFSHATAPSRAPAPQSVPPGDTARSAPPSRESIPARWFALHNIFPAQVLEPSRERTRIPVLAVFSFAGGVGKTCLIATLGRALLSLGERVLLVDTAPFGMLPFFYGARDQRPGVLRTFIPPDAGHDSRIDILALDIERFGAEGNVPEPITQEILRHSNGADRILIDLATASINIVRRILRMSPTVLVPVMPDVGSVASVSSIEQFFERNSSGTGETISPFYIFNQFDESQRLHRDVREVLRSQLRERLLPFALRRSSGVSEALADGMTVMDYAPDSSAAEDYARVAGWLRSMVASSQRGPHSARWSER
jgi:cellulose synthase operon protein YhjQ